MHYSRTMILFVLFKKNTQNLVLENDTENVFAFCYFFESIDERDNGIFNKRSRRRNREKKGTIGEGGTFAGR